MKKKFTIIKGNNNTEDHVNRKFISAYVTNTRLMGVIGMYIHWKINGEDLYQLFHFDAEEYGFDNYKSIYGDNKESLYIEKEKMMGGLGGKYLSLKENEARYIFQRFMSINIKNNLPLPEPRSEFTFLYKNKVELEEIERKILMNKICEGITSEYQIINYFLMRSFANDEECVKVLTDGKDIQLYKGKKPTTLLKNTIEEFVNEEGLSYLCESLIEEKLKYKIEISEIVLNKKGDNLYISEAHSRSSLNVSPTEAAFMLNRPEYINIYEIYNISDFIDVFKDRKPYALQNLHSTGYLFTEFNTDNRHVKENIYMLNGDIYGVYYITSTGQMIMASYDLDHLDVMEKYFSKGELSEFVSLVERLEFKESILYEFVHSGYDDFFEFLTEF